MFTNVWKCWAAASFKGFHCMFMDFCRSLRVLFLCETETKSWTSECSPRGSRADRNRPVPPDDSCKQPKAEPESPLPVSLTERIEGQSDELWGTWQLGTAAKYLTPLLCGLKPTRAPPTPSGAVLKRTGLGQDSNPAGRSGSGVGADEDGSGVHPRFIKR